MSGTLHTSPTTLAGYTFTRTGQQGAIDAAGAVQWFAANTPAINSAGFHAYGAATNTLRESQTFDSATWTKLNSTVTANAIAAPDGTTTADLIVENTATGPHGVDAAVSPSPPVSTVLSISTIVKYAGRQWLWIAPYGPAGGATNYAWFDIQNGVVGNRGSTTVSSSITPLVDGFYRCTVLITTTASAGSLSIGLRGQTANGATADYAGSGGNAFHLWQAQCLDGNHPNGGPLIVTTTAAATCGEALMTHNIFADGSALADEDMLIWVNATASEISAGTQTLATLYVSANERIRLQLVGGVLTAIVTVGGVDVYSQTVAGALTTGTAFSGALRRSGSNWRVSKHVSAALSSGTEASAAFPTGMTKAYVGNAAAGAAALRGLVDSTFIQLGTFDTDQKVINAITGAP